MTAPDLPTWRLFWAKTDYQNEGTDAHDPAWTHPLWAHLLDVAHTAHLLWERAVPDGLRREAADALGLGEAEAGHLLSLRIGLHDWGKASPHFQSRHAPSRDALEAHGLRCDGEDARHEHLTAALVYRQLQKERPSGEQFWAHLGASVGIHHGRLVDRRTWEAHARSATRGGALGDPRQWEAPQDDLQREVAAVWRRRYPWPDPPRVPTEPAPDWLLGLAGWTTFADWLGSISECFPYDVAPSDDLDTYLHRSRAGAEAALARAGLATPRVGMVARPFGELFEGFTPRPLQALVLDPAFPTAASDRPTLTIIEAPTGEGKTEAALALAARQQDGRRGGLYLALPTQATANGLVDRAVRFLETAHASGPADFRLAHGRAQLLDAQRALVERPEALGAVDGGGDARVRTLGWFLSSKRALLAPYGLGTIDQALLGAVRGRHFFLRLYGLAGKTVVLDEIHAYDVYMQTLIGRLLGWLRALGAHVVLLSATLPARLRTDLTRAWDPGATGDLAPAEPTSVPYPAVWTVADGRATLHAAHDGQPLRAERTQRATLARHDHAPDAIAATVAEAVATGVVVGVIVNTVARAQAVFEAVERLLGDDLPAGDVVLFHARFLQRDRARIERHVVGHKADDGTWVPGRFGKGRAAGPAVLVATQVAEQSLDLDLDLLLTDLAPVDLMLQRAGRLHRHERDDRPADYREPHVFWLCPDAPADGLPDVRSDDVPFGFVYDPVVLWRTWALLRSREEAGGVGRWSLPADYRPLIEAVYPADETVTASPSPPDGLSAEGAERWAAAVAEGRGKRMTSVENAGHQLIPAPGDLRELFSRVRRALHDEDDEAAHHTLRAATREGDSVEVVVLFTDGADGLFLDPSLTEAAPLDRPDPKAPLPTAAVRRLLGASVRLSSPAIVGALRARHEAEAPARWWEAAKATPALLGMHLLVLEKETARVSGRRITFDARLGIVIERTSA